MQPHIFLDKVAYERAGQMIAKADALFRQRKQKVATLCGTLRLLSSIYPVVKDGKFRIC